MNLSGENEGGQDARVGSGCSSESEWAGDTLGPVSGWKTLRTEENAARPGTGSELGISGCGEPDGQRYGFPKSYVKGRVPDTIGCDFITGSLQMNAAR